jgi:hypothetical protein
MVKRRGSDRVNASSQEAEEIDQDVGAHPLKQRPAEAPREPAPQAAEGDHRHGSAFPPGVGWLRGLCVRGSPKAGSAALRTSPGRPSASTASSLSQTVLGISIDFSPLDPIKALFVINGFVAVPVMAAMMWVGSRRDQMAGSRCALSRSRKGG